MQQTNEKKGTGQMSKDQHTETEKNKQADKNKEATQRHPTTGHHPADKEVTGQQHSSDNDGAPVHPMHKAKPVEQQSKKENDKENMGSGKRQDDN